MELLNLLSSGYCSNLSGSFLGLLISQSDLNVNLFTLSFGVDFVDVELFHMLFSLIEAGTVLYDAVGDGFDRFCSKHV